MSSGINEEAVLSKIDREQLKKWTIEMVRIMSPTGSEAEMVSRSWPPSRKAGGRGGKNQRYRHTKRYRRRAYAAV